MKKKDVVHHPLRQTVPGSRRRQTGGPRGTERYEGRTEMKGPVTETVETLFLSPSLRYRAPSHASAEGAGICLVWPSPHSRQKYYPLS